MKKILVLTKYFLILYNVEEVTYFLKMRNMLLIAILIRNQKAAASISILSLSPPVDKTCYFRPFTDLDFSLNNYVQNHFNFSINILSSIYSIVRKICG